MNLFDGYRISSEYGYRMDPITNKVDLEFHKGIDLVKPNKSAILSFVGGTVVYAKMGVVGSGFGNYGNVVAIKDKYGYLHCYCHLDSVNVKVGQAVPSNVVIGLEGATGNVTGAHLHYEVRKQSTPSFGLGTHVDPTEYLTEFLRKEEITMTIEDADKLIDLLSAIYKGFEKTESHRLANVLRKVSGQKEQ